MDTPVTGTPRTLLRLEGLAVLVSAVLGYAALGASWHLFALWLGAWPVCLIWVTHIGMDRLFGLGLKFPTAFRDTHLGTVGRAA